MDKNQGSVEKICKIIFSESLSSISFDDAITKTYFFHRLITIAEIPTIYLDFDLLYSGYLAANILPQNQNLTVHQPKDNTWKDQLVDVLDRISKEKHLVIIDSLNGFFATMAEQKDSGRIINSITVLLASAGQKTNSAVLIGSVSKFKKDEGWVLPTIGRHVIEIERMNLLSVRKQNSQLYLSLVDNHNFEKSSLQITDLDLM